MPLESLTNWMIADPKLSIVLVSLLVTIIMTLVTKKFTDQNRMKELKEIQKACQIKLKTDEVKNSPEEMKKIQSQMMECSMELMKHSFRPMFITLLPLFGLFWWIRDIYALTELNVKFLIMPVWIWWYIGTGIISSIILRKVLKVY